MSTSDQQIECRKCKELISAEADSCPHCGKSVRGIVAPVAIIVIGAIVSIASAMNLGDLWFYLLVGLAMVGVGAFLIIEKRRRIQNA